MYDVPNEEKTLVFFKELVVQWRRNNLRFIPCLMDLFQVPLILIMRLDIKMFSF